MKTLFMNTHNQQRRKKHEGDQERDRDRFRIFSIASNVRIAAEESAPRNGRNETGESQRHHQKY